VRGDEDGSTGGADVVITTSDAREDTATEVEVGTTTTRLDAGRLAAEGIDSADATGSLMDDDGKRELRRGGICLVGFFALARLRGFTGSFH
jgi:hypothetical protein